MTCHGSTDLNRHPISLNCSCKDGYYTDGGSVGCKKCDVQCLTCEGKADNCLKFDNSVVVGGCAF